MSEAQEKLGTSWSPEKIAAFNRMVLAKERRETLNPADMLLLTDLELLANGLVAGSADLPARDGP